MTAADLIFDPMTHTSKTPDGRDVPHVTHILKAVGVALDFDGLRQDLGPRVAERIDFRRELGTVVHTDLHSFDDRDLVVATVDDRVKPYIEAWGVFRQQLKLTPIVRERRVLNLTYNYTGILDGIFHQNGTGKRILIDVKIGDPAAAGAHLQTAAYEAAYLAEHPDFTIDQRWAVRLCPELAIPYRITNYSDRRDAWRDFQKFQACLTVYAEQFVRRGVA